MMHSRVGTVKCTSLSYPHSYRLSLVDCETKALT